MEQVKYSCKAGHSPEIALSVNVGQAETLPRMNNHINHSSDRNGRKGEGAKGRMDERNTQRTFPCTLFHVPRSLTPCTLFHVPCSLLCALLFFLTVSLSGWAQTGGEVGSVEGVPAVYIVDGENGAYVWGSQAAGGKIVIGLTEEGFYELRGDSAIWHINHPRLGDYQVAHILHNNKTNISTIVAGAAVESPKRPNMPVNPNSPNNSNNPDNPDNFDSPDNPDASDNLDSPNMTNDEDDMLMDIIGIYNTENGEILNKDREPVAIIDMEGKVVNAHGKTFLRFNPQRNPVDRELIVFFFLYHYQVLHGREIK
jgi:hypothetical protein